jgi:tetrahydromethanopterin S-methyltransferase subunit D
MLIVLAAVAVGIAVWASWLVRVGRAPRAVRWIGRGVLVAAALSGAGTWWQLRRLFAAAAEVSPAERQAVLSSGAASAMITLAVGCVITLVAAIALGYFTLASTPRAG